VLRLINGLFELEARLTDVALSPGLGFPQLGDDLLGTVTLPLHRESPARLGAVRLS
jgi:hypothetical protein